MLMATFAMRTFEGNLAMATAATSRARVAMRRFREKVSMATVAMPRSRRIMTMATFAMS